MKIVGYVRRIRNIDKRDYYICHVCLFVRPSVRPSAWNNSASAEGIFIKFDIESVFDNLSRKFKVD